MAMGSEEQNSINVLSAYSDSGGEVTINSRETIPALFFEG